MLPPTRGSEAFKLEPLRKERISERERVLREQRRALAEKQKKEQQRKLKQKAAAARELRRKAAVLSFVFAIFAMLGSVVVGYANISAAALDASSLKKELSQVNQSVDELSIELTMKTDMNQIKQIAAEELNMGYPNEYQVVTVRIDDKQTNDEMANSSGAEVSVEDILGSLID